MLELADIVRAVKPEERARLAVLPSQKRALQAIEQCRTAALGGQLFECNHCGAAHYSYHSCGNRHCPKCHGQQTERWLERQSSRLLPCAYYLLTFTLPRELHGLARSHQKVMYGLLMSCAAASVQKLCKDPQWLGAQAVLLGVLHTWTRALLYHPHAHFLVSAGGLSADGQQWIEAKHPNFLLPVRALSQIFRAKMRDALKARGWLGALPAGFWAKPWVVHAQPSGRGEKVLQYLGRYVFRIAISNSRLERFENGQVTFRYRDNRTQQIKHLTLSTQQFLARFVQHVLPQGFAKVRHYGLGAAACQKRHAQARALLEKLQTAAAPGGSLPQTLITLQPAAPGRCPACGSGQLIFRQKLRPQRRIPP